MDFPKSVPSVGLVDGKFIDEDALSGTPGSLIPSAWGNAVTLEILNVLQAAGLVPDEDDNAQLLAAISSLVEGVALEFASQAEAVGGVNEVKVMSPLRVAQAITAALTAATESAYGLVRIATQAQTNTGATDDVVITPKKLAAFVSNSLTAATESSAGLIRVATQAETNGGVNDGVAVTPKKLAAFVSNSLTSATESAYGLVRIATQAQTNAGTSDATVVTPKKLALFVSNSLTAATESSAGLMRVATQTETNDGVSDGVGVTPKKMAAYVTSKSNLIGIQGSFKNLTLSSGGSDRYVSAAVDELLVEDTSGVFLKLSNISLTIDTTASGANGLDSGSATASTWYSVWAISNATGSVVAGLLSINVNLPALPAGYTHKARIGWVRTDASLYPLRFSQFGKRAHYDLGGNVPSFPTVATGAASTAITVSLASLVPPTAKYAHLVGGTANGGYIGFAPAGGFVSTPGAGYLSPSQPNGFPFAGGYNASSPVPTAVGTINLRSLSVMYCATGASSILQCMGWEDNL